MKKALFGIMACLALFSLVLTGCDDLLGALKDEKGEGVEEDKGKDSAGGKDTENSQDSTGGTGEDYSTIPDDWKAETTLTVNDIPQDVNGQNYYFIVFPYVSRPEGLFDAEPVAGNSGKITGPTLSGTIHSEKPLSGDYTGVVLVGSQSKPDYVGYADITIRNSTASIGFSAFTKVTDEYIESQSSNGGKNTGDSKDPNGGKDTGDSKDSNGSTDEDYSPIPDDWAKTTFTINGIYSDITGQDYSFIVFPRVNGPEALFDVAPVAGNSGKITGSTLSGTIYSEKPLSGDYTGVVIVGSPEDPKYVGYANITITGGKGSISLEDFETVTEEYKKNQSSNSNDGFEYPDGKPNNGDDPYGLLDATNWNESRWSSWFDEHPASDPYFIQAVLEFESRNYRWVEASSWWTSLYGMWVSGSAGPGPGEQLVDDSLAGATDWDAQQWNYWFGNHPAYDSNNVVAVSSFTSANSSWLGMNPWWSSLYSKWLSGVAY
jgi:hypothetical protein